MAESFLLVGLVGAALFYGYLTNEFFKRTKIPDVLLLIAAGILIGPVTHLVEPSDLAGAAPFIGALALAIIVFEGGLKTNALKLARVVGEASWFTVLTSLLTVAVVALAALSFEWGLPQALLLGAVLAGTSYEIIAPMVRSLSLSDKAKNLLNLESAFNGVLAIVTAVAAIQFVKMNALDLQFSAQLFASSLIVGIVFGGVAAFLWLKAIEPFKGKQFAYLLTLASVFLLYGLTEYASGNGVVSVLVYGVVLSNAHEFVKKKALLDPAIPFFQTEVAFLVKTLFFIFMGVIVDLNAFTNAVIVLALACFSAIVLTRFAATRLLTRLDEKMLADENAVWSILPRGLTAMVLASVPASQGIVVPGLVEVTVVVVLATNLFTTAAVFALEKSH
ncbi:hypothetical protein COX85_01120 [Candidatus Micrarchaeota archaeon CG_4_10_14_0_2_um_filter_55_9]|nr:MAG: hypothetical protein COT57_01745 [Candidatus Micrarchaeota archaeon CG09_land_8_20_14_0_10_55_25]PIZ91952.1 MAG: hypothetical protein COX85_01120 [Candidatus Micrarchaeota archaeon CG_4_10_14_0_2_um_filter_55_9]PJD00817.1 MAG: hypothetical protein COU38_04305 [Candidatus Micrarchaeota archaeon CG10_big_fil_rev_8_21_14_0_10_54_18]